MKASAFGTASVLAVALALGASAREPRPLGPDFQVNTYTPSLQRSPGLAPAADGGFLVVWRSDGSSGDDDSSWSVQGRRYGVTGAPTGSDFQVNLHTPDSQIFPVAQALGDGFVVLWQSLGSAGDPFGYGVLLRRLAGDGGLSAGELQVNAVTPGDQRHPAVAPAADGGFLVVWDGPSINDDDPDLGIRSRRFAADGSAAGPELRVNRFTPGEQIFPSVAALADGGFLVAWQSDGSPGNDPFSRSIVGRRLDAAGRPVADDFQLNAFTPGFQGTPSVAGLVDGGFVAAWTSGASAGGDTSSYSVQARRFDAAGAPRGLDFQVNVHTPGDQIAPRTVAWGDGGFVVVWQSSGSAGTDTDRTSIQARRFAADGAVAGAELQVNAFTTLEQITPVAVPLANGRLAVAWASSASPGDDDSVSSILARRFDLPLFADGFETGDHRRWHFVFPPEASIADPSSR